MFFGKKIKKEQKTYDKENQKPVIRASICTGEMVACFKDLRTGELQEIMLVKDESDIEDFMQQYGITERPEKIY
ncbi:MAG: aspartate dehydrogenase [Butyrivibrio sp.]|nr:aspartate dehydrogenase [Butyrivibrio sp.]